MISQTLVDGNGRPMKLDYEAAEDKKRRQPPRVRLMSEDKHLKPQSRKKLIATSRDLVRNYTVASWMIRKHLDYVSTFSFQSRTGNEKLDRQLEELMTWWSRRNNFDIAGRHNLARFTRMAEARRTLDGDFFTLKLSSGRVQAIEGDRIRTPLGTGKLPKNIERDRLIHGVWVTKTGRARGYCLCDRNKLGDGFEFKRIIPARHVVAHGYYDRFDQVRGIPLVAPGINVLQDTYEGLDYAIAKAKVAQLFGLKLKREAEESTGDVTITSQDETLDKSETTIDFGRGPFQLDLDIGEDADIMESKNPPQVFQDFLKLLIMISLKSVDIPYGFFDEAHTNYAGNRQAWLLYDQSAETKRDDNRELLNSLAAWQIMLWILDDRLVLPKSMTIKDLRWEWMNRGIPWIDPLKEIKADGEAIDRALSSRQRILKRQGSDFYEIADELAAENEYLEAKGLPTTSVKAVAKTAALAEMDIFELADRIAEALADLSERTNHA